MKKSNSQLSQLESLYHAFSKGLFFYCKQLKVPEEDAVEIVNDVFLAVWNKKDALPLNKSLKAYLYKATHNKAINFLVKKRIQFNDVDYAENIGDQNLDPLRALEFKQTKKALFDRIDLLPPRCKQIFLLSRVEQFSYKEIAEIMDIAPKTVENQIAIALKDLKLFFKPNNNNNNSDDI